MNQRQRKRRAQNRLLDEQIIDLLEIVNDDEHEVYRTRFDVVPAILSERATETYVLGHKLDRQELQFLINSLKNSKMKSLESYISELESDLFEKNYRV